MGTDHRAFTALNAGLRVPRGNLQCDIAFFPLRGAGREGAVDRESADGNAVTVAGVDYAEDIALEFWGLRGECVRRFGFASDLLRNGDFEEVGQSFVDGAEVLLHDLFAFSAVRVADGFANGFDGFFAGKNF